ncbi:chemotaxis protein CheA [Lentibacillus salicampi]|uniref:Chemotaxis protein CheA n=1 Tax=Lentibacillus salicampi TaxID=175306 RepID=A0A4Y9AEP0_9BACI|nr:chemotaxis protein CheA [Lentibacillus salicampi]TFJ94296.1 chemotaxis protein CheA [Lentibacillus salicampi]
MDTNDYISLFLDDSNEHIQAMNDHLLKLEKQPGNIDIVHAIFRSAHTLKGMAGSMAFDDIASLTHKMENIFDKIRNNELAVNEEVMEILFEALEDLEEMTHEIGEGDGGKRDVRGLVYRLEQLEKGTSDLVHGQIAAAINPAAHVELDQYQRTVLKQAKEQDFSTLQITIKLSEDCLLKAARVYMVFEVLEKLGDMIKSTPAVEELEAENFNQEFTVILLSTACSGEIKERIHNISEVQDVVIANYDIRESERSADNREDRIVNEIPVERYTRQDKFKHTENKRASTKTIRVSSERIEHLMNLFEELALEHGRLEDIATQLNNQELIDTTEQISKISRDMESFMLTIRMAPVGQIFNRFPLIVRGLAKDLNKKIDLNIIGAETELDRAVIDEIRDPLIHLIRNSADHGIEPPDKRKEKGKPEAGNLLLRAFPCGNHVFIEVEDDGGGINREKVMKKAIENGLLTAEGSENIKDEAIHQFIFATGFSTAKNVSSISGRGVGLDAVRMKIESLGGDISVESEPGLGTKFSIQLPWRMSNAGNMTG